VTDMRRFWNARARQDPLHFVDDREPPGEGDLERFWHNGGHDLGVLLGALAVEVEPWHTVLDLGCGVGRLTRVLAERARRVVAVDVSPEMLELARGLNRELGNVEWLLGDGRTLQGVPDGSIDAAVSHVVFQHLPYPAITLGYVAELARVLDDGGWAAFQLSTDPSVHRRRLRDLGRPQRDAAWLGSAVDLARLRDVADSVDLDLARIEHPGTQFTLVLAYRKPRRRK